MKKILHKEFLASNKLEVSTFTKAVQKKVSIFDKMYDKLEETIGDDKKSLLDQLHELDLEIREDMLMELEDELENNEIIEEEPEKKPESEKKPVPPPFKQGDTVEITGGQPDYLGIVGKVVEYHEPSGKDKESVTVEAHGLPDGKGLYNVNNVKKTTKKPSQAPKKAMTDEGILDELWKMNRTKGVKRSFLVASGIKTPIEGWTVQIGKYTLNRAAVFSYKYNLVKQH